jgi:hypothetical protein
MEYERYKSLCIRIIFKIWMNLEELKVPHLAFDVKRCCMFYVWRISNEYSETIDSEKKCMTPQSFILEF